MRRVRETSLTVGYQSEHWGIERIVLDSLSNHLPSDSKGTDFSIDFLTKSGEWISYDTAKRISPENIEAVKFEDDGVGYSDVMLGLLYSTKKSDSESIGEKGEGLKMALKACLENDIDVEIKSTFKDKSGNLRSWKASPFTVDVSDDVSDAVVKQVHFNVDDTDSNGNTGSATIFKKPPAEFVKYLREKLEERVLAFNPRQRNLFQTDAGDIIEGDGLFYIKGIYITDSLKGKLAFNYNLKSVSPNRDRNNVNLAEVKYGLRKVLEKVSDEDLIKKFVKKGETTDFLEFDVLGSDFVKRIDPLTKQEIIKEQYSLVGNWELWKKAFHDLYGEKAVLSYGNKDKIAELHGYKVIKLSSSLRSFLNRSGVRDSSDLQFDDSDFLLRDEEVDYSKLDIFSRETSFTANTGRVGWGPLRIALDTISNHMPKDSGGNNIAIEYLVNKKKFGENSDNFLWVPTSSLEYNTEVYGIRVKDDGKGYDIEKLPLLFTDKENDSSSNDNYTGGFGEGAKMVSIAVLREQQTGEKDTRIKFRSRDGTAIPVWEDIVLDSKKTKRMHLLMAKNLENIVGSLTTIYNPTSAITRIFRDINFYVMHFNSEYNPILKTEVGALFDPSKYSNKNKWSEKSVFVNGFFVTGSYDKNLLYNYNLNLDVTKISPDRDMINPVTTRSCITQLVKSCENSDIIKNIIDNANRHICDDYFEFAEIDFKDDKEKAGIWKNSFYELYGQKAVLCTGNISVASEAIHQGYIPIGLNSRIWKTIHNSGVLTDRDVVSEGLVPDLVDENDLSEVEKKVFRLIPSVDTAVFACQDPKPDLPIVKIFSEVHTKNGELKENVLGFYRRSDDIIFIRRNCLSQNEPFIKVYTHERGHQFTGGRDADDIFREYFEDLSYLYIGREILEEDPLSARISKLKDRLISETNNTTAVREEFASYRTRAEEETRENQERFQNKYDELRNEYAESALRDIQTAFEEFGTSYRSLEMKHLGLEREYSDLQRNYEVNVENLQRMFGLCLRFFKPEERTKISQLSLDDAVNYVSSKLGNSRVLIGRKAS